MRFNEKNSRLLHNIFCYISYEIIIIFLLYLLWNYSF